MWCSEPERDPRGSTYPPVTSSDPVDLQWPCWICSPRRLSFLIPCLLTSSPNTSLYPTGKHFLYWCPTLSSGWDPKQYLFCLGFQFYFIILSFTKHRALSGDGDQVGSKACPQKHHLSSNNPCCSVQAITQNSLLGVILLSGMWRPSAVPQPVHQLQLSRSVSQLPRAFKFSPMVLLGTRPIRWWEVCGVALSFPWQLGGRPLGGSGGEYPSGQWIRILVLTYCTPSNQEME